MREDFFDLNGKVAVITGGNGHLGSHMCKALASYGATIIVASRDVNKCSFLVDSLKEQYGGDHSAFKLEIENENDFRDLFKTAYDRYGHIDILINNANFTRGLTIESCDYESWETSMQGTINAVYKGVREVLPYMLNQKSGKIINIASMYGLFAPNPNIYKSVEGQNSPPGYGAGKAAIIQFTKYIAAYYGTKGIICNAVCPGAFPNVSPTENREFISTLAERTMLGRIGNPEEIEGIVVFLASQASSYITGQALSVDGGISSW